jgi:hypothetical protein
LSRQIGQTRPAARRSARAWVRAVASRRSAGGDQMPPSSCRAGAGAGSRPRRPQPVGGRRGRGIGVLECPASAIKVGLGSRTTRNEEGPGDQADHGFDVQTAGRGSRRGRRTIGPMATRDRLIAVACEVALDRRFRTDEERIGPRGHGEATTGLKPALSYSSQFTLLEVDDCAGQRPGSGIGTACSPDCRITRPGSSSLPTSTSRAWSPTRPFALPEGRHQGVGTR